MTNLEKAKSLLKEGDFTCVLVSEDKIFTSKKRGVSPLLEFIESKEDFSHYSAADKVVGKGAALLYALMKIKALHAEVISKSAAEVLKKQGILFTYSSMADHIINRRGDDVCPMEKATMNTESPFEAYGIITDLLNKLKG